MLGSGFVIVQTSRHGARSKRDWLLIILSAFDFVASFAMVFGQRLPAPDESPNTACVAQAAGTIFPEVASNVWTANLSLEVVQSLRHGRQPLSAAATRRGILRPLVPALLVPAASCAVISAVGGWGDATLWCWVSSHHPEWQLALYYLPLVIAWSVSVCSFVAVRIGHLAAAAPRDAGGRAADARPVARSPPTRCASSLATFWSL